MLRAALCPAASRRRTIPRNEWRSFEIEHLLMAHKQRLSVIRAASDDTVDDLDPAGGDGR